MDSSDLLNLRDFHRTWPLSLLPAALKPYGELMRLHRPAGVMMFYLPCCYGAFLVGSLGLDITLLKMLSVNAKLLLLSFLMRSTFCTWNDIIDKDIDRQVKRTRIRPLAREVVTIPQAIIWFAIQATSILSVFIFLLPPTCLNYSSPFLLLHLIYPWMKRLLHHPQIILGLAYPLGVFIAFPALERPLSFRFLREEHNAGICCTNAVLCMSAAIFLWTVLNDTIYAAQDLEDDRKAGVGSPMIYWGDSARKFLRILAILQLLALAGITSSMQDNKITSGVVYLTFTCGSTTIALLSMVEGVDLSNPVNCGWWFNKGNLLVGCAIGSGLVAEYLVSFLL